MARGIDPPMPHLLIAALFAVPVGIMLGLLGGGGSVLLLPVLVYGLGVGEKEAIATSLLVVMLTSIMAATQHARRGTVRWRMALLFAPSAMVGAFTGGTVAQFIPGPILLVVFATLMLVTAGAMWRGQRPDPGRAKKERSRIGRVARISLIGFMVGAVTGLVGAGGGFLIVPALALLTGAPMREAIATSLVIIAANSAAGLAGYVGHVSIDGSLALTVSAAAIAGSFVGAMACALVPQARLRRGFAVFVAVMGVGILVKEIPAQVRAARAPSRAGAYALVAPPVPEYSGCSERVPCSAL